MEHIDPEVKELVENILRQLRGEVDNRIAERVSDIQDLAQSELAAAIERQTEPLGNSHALVEDSKLVAELIQKTCADPSRTPERVRFVAAMFRGLVDYWYPRPARH